MSRATDDGTSASDDALVRVGRRLGGAARRVVALTSAPSALWRSAARRARAWHWPFGRSAAAVPDPTFVKTPRRAKDAAKAAPGVPDLAALASDEGLQSLARALADPDPSVRALALDVVCEFSGSRAARLLGGMLQDPEPSVRRAAAAAATRIQTSAVVFSLILALEDVDTEVRASAAAGIESITARRIDRAALEEPALRGVLVEDLKTWWKDRRLAELAAGDGTSSGRR